MTAEAGDGSIEIEWDDPGDASINGYEYCAKTTSGADCTSWQTISGATATTTMHTISGLANGTTYYVRIRARNAVGPSGASNQASATPTAGTTQPPTPVTYAPAATAGAGGSVSCATASGTVPCSGPLEENTAVTVTAEAGDGYDFSHWTGDCAGQSASCALTMSGPRSTQAHFAAESTVPPPDTAPMFGRESVSYWTTVDRSVRQTLPGASGGNGALSYSLSGNLPPGHRFEEPRTVRGAATAVGTYVSTLTVSDSDGNHAASDQDTLTVTITVRPRPEWTLTVTESGCCGSVSQDPSPPYYRDADPAVAVTLTATPSAGYRVASWSGACRGSGTTCTVTMNANKGASVSFEARPTWGLDVSTSGCCGSVSVSPSGPYYQGDNTSVTLTAAAAAAHPSSAYFAGWSGGCSGTSSTCTVTMNGNKSVTASFDNDCDGNTGIGCRRQDDAGGETPPPPDP